MRLLKTQETSPGVYATETFLDSSAPPYAILSHTWSDGELTFQDVESGRGQDKPGFEKLQRSCAYAQAYGFEYIWNDTCCIDKTSSAELTEAINSMFQWYENAEVCYAYLADVPDLGFAESRWFTRGWTLQELIAPTTVVFLDRDWREIGTKEGLKRAITDCTGIPGNILDGDHLESASVAQRMSWAAKRKTTRPEDRAYSLLGLFGVNMPLLYGEGERAFIRLQEEIFRISDDQTLFAWRSSDDRGGLFATGPEAFAESGDIIAGSQLTSGDSVPIISNRGVHLELPFIGIGQSGLGLAVLNLPAGKGFSRYSRTALYLQDEDLTMQNFRRVQTHLVEHIDLSELFIHQRPTRKLCIRIGRTLGPSKLSPRKALHSRDNNDLLPFVRPDFGRLIRDPSATANALRETIKAGDKDAVERLILSTSTLGGANDPERDGSTPLLHAATMGRTHLVWLLLTRGDFQPRTVDNRGRNMLHYAAMNGHRALVKVLLIRRDTLELRKVVDKDGCIPFDLAVRREDSSFTGLFVMFGE